MGDPLPPSFAPRARPLQLLATLVGWVVLTVVLSSLLAPPVFDLVDALFPGRFPFQRVLRRVAMVVAIAGLVTARRRLGISSLAQIGMAWSRARGRALVTAALVGAVALAAVGALELAFGRRVGAVGLSAGGAAEAVVGAGLIGLLEEGLLRGAFLFPFGRLVGAAFVVANGAISALYATVHFARGVGSIEVVDWGSGWSVWAALPVTAAAHSEAWFGLFATGVLFYVLAWRQGHAWGAVGLHAGAVLALQIFGGLSEQAPGQRSLLLVDGLLPGYGVAAPALLAAALLLIRPARSEG